MASPLSVCQLLGADATFDYVIFDEASQILPEDAIPSIVRAKHAIVAGDNHQLPPTTFFAAAEEEEDESDADGTGYESLLDMMIPFVRGSTSIGTIAAAMSLHRILKPSHLRRSARYLPRRWDSESNFARLRRFNSNL